MLWKAATDCWDELWQGLAEGVTNRRSEFHLAACANVDASGAARVRTVVLRYAEEATATLGFHSDGRSQRISDLGVNPFGQMVLYAPTPNVQIRLFGRYEVHIEDDVARAVWAATPVYSRKCYLAEVPSSEELLAEPEADQEQPTLADSERGFTNFAVVRLHATEIEYLSLAAPGHLRWRWVKSGDAWAHARISP
ncbi:MAG: hypothetical protein JNJ45_05740 [Chthonomonas sp.]|nr:hypothetical protein [Chthonomonas sp.]